MHADRSVCIMYKAVWWERIDISKLQFANNVNILFTIATAAESKSI